MTIQHRCSRRYLSTRVLGCVLAMICASTSTFAEPTSPKVTLENLQGEWRSDGQRLSGTKDRISVSAAALSGVIVSLDYLNANFVLVYDHNSVYFLHIVFSDKDRLRLSVLNDDSKYRVCPSGEFDKQSNQQIVEPISVHESKLLNSQNGIWAQDAQVLSIIDHHLMFGIDDRAFDIIPSSTASVSSQANLQRIKAGQAVVCDFRLQKVDRQTILVSETVEQKSCPIGRFHRLIPVIDIDKTTGSWIELYREKPLIIRRDRDGLATLWFQNGVEGGDVRIIESGTFALKAEAFGADISKKCILSAFSNETNGDLYLLDGSGRNDCRGFFLKRVD